MVHGPDGWLLVYCRLIFSPNTLRCQRQHLRDGHGFMIELQERWTRKKKKTTRILHPGRLTLNIVIEVRKMIFLFNWVIFRFHVNLPGCMDPDLHHGFSNWKQKIRNNRRISKWSFSWVPQANQSSEGRRGSLQAWPSLEWLVCGFNPLEKNVKLDDFPKVRGKTNMFESNT